MLSAGSAPPCFDNWTCSKWYIYSYRLHRNNIINHNYLETTTPIIRIHKTLVNIVFTSIHSVCWQSETTSDNKKKPTNTNFLQILFQIFIWYKVLLFLIKETAAIYILKAIHINNDQFFSKHFPQKEN